MTGKTNKEIVQELRWIVEYLESINADHLQRKTMMEAADLIESLTWIPVKIKPEVKSRHYLVLSKMNLAHGGTWEDNKGDARRNMKVAYYDCTGKFNQPYVTHWMPLPTPPKEEVI